VKEPWTVVIFVGIATAAFKAVGPVAIGGRDLPPRFLRLVEALAPALLAALVATQTFATGRDLVLDERALGLGAALVAILLRAPVLAIIVIAAVVTALARTL
jgi:uncharacterized membrane protein